MAIAPLVSVILPVYNRFAFVGRAIESVLAQTHQPLELIVVDDGSTDGTREVVARFGSAVTLLTQDHAGAYAARNLGIENARGEFVAFIDSDDVWLPNRLSDQLPLMRREEVGLVFGDARLRRAESEPLQLTCFRINPPHRGRVAHEFAYANFVSTSTVLVRGRCLDEVGGFPMTGALSEDYLTWFRIALRHELDFVDVPVAEYTVHAEGISSDLGKSIEARIALFTGELARTSDPATRGVLRRLIFNLSLHLALAVPRGRARSVAHPLRLAWRTASHVARLEAAPWTAAFAVNQVRARTRRLFS